VALLVPPAAANPPEYEKAVVTSKSAESREAITFLGLQLAFYLNGCGYEIITLITANPGVTLGHVSPRFPCQNKTLRDANVSVISFGQEVTTASTSLHMLMYLTQVEYMWGSNISLVSVVPRHPILHRDEPSVCISLS